MLHEEIRRRVRNLGIKGGDFAALVGVSQPKMSGFLRGRSSFDAARMKEIQTTLDDLESFKKYFPIPLGVHDPALLAIALERFRDGLFERFRKAMTATDWERTYTQEHLSLKYPRIFNERPKRPRGRVVTIKEDGQ